MKKEGCTYTCGFLVSVLGVIIVCLFLFPTVHMETIQQRYVYTLTQGESVCVSYV